MIILRILSKDRTSNSAINANFGWKDQKVVLIWGADVEQNSAIHAEESTEAVNATDDNMFDFIKILTRKTLIKFHELIQL